MTIQIIERGHALRRAITALTLSAAAVLMIACGDVVSPPSRHALAHPGFSDGLMLGQCLLHLGLTGTKVEPIVGGNVTIEAPAGEVVTRVAIKGGTQCWFTPEGASGTYTFLLGGTACYVVAGLGTGTATVTRVGDGPSCKDISHIELITQPAVATTGSLQLCLIVVGTDPPPESLTFPFPFVVAGQSISVANDACSAPIVLPAGTVVVSEQQPNPFGIGWWSVVTLPDDRLVGFDVAAQAATVNVIAGSTSVVRITNLWEGHGLD